jgi:hypothetical protein
MGSDRAVGRVLLLRNISSIWLPYQDEERPAVEHRHRCRVCGGDRHASGRRLCEGAQAAARNDPTIPPWCPGSALVTVIRLGPGELAPGHPGRGGVLAGVRVPIVLGPGEQQPPSATGARKLTLKRAG